MKNLFRAIGAWLPDALIRAVKTFGQATVAALVVPVNGSVSLDQWHDALALGGTAAVLSLLNNLASLNIAAAAVAQDAINVTTVVPSTVTPVVSDLDDPDSVGDVPAPEDDTDVDHDAPSAPTEGSSAS